MGISGSQRYPWNPCPSMDDEDILILIAKNCVLGEGHSV